MAFCPNCGKEIDESDQFCKGCGSKITADGDLDLEHTKDLKTNNAESADVDNKAWIFFMEIISFMELFVFIW